MVWWLALLPWEGGGTLLQNHPFIVQMGPAEAPSTLIHSFLPYSPSISVCLHGNPCWCVHLGGGGIGGALLHMSTRDFRSHCLDAAQWDRASA